MSLVELLDDNFMEELEQKHNPIGVADCNMELMVFDATKRLFSVAPKLMENNTFSTQDISNHINQYFCL